MWNQCWIMEDDVVFTHAKICLELIEKYERNKSDLIVPNFFTRAKYPRWAHWNTAKSFQYEHQAGAFLPLCRISRRLVHLVDCYVKKHGSLSFIESLLPSLVVRHNLAICRNHGFH